MTWGHVGKIFFSSSLMLRQSKLGVFVPDLLGECTDLAGAYSCPVEHLTKPCPRFGSQPSRGDIAI